MPAAAARACMGERGGKASKSYTSKACKGEVMQVIVVAEVKSGCFRDGCMTINMVQTAAEDRDPVR
jgi:hypothetical protein